MAFRIALHQLHKSELPELYVKVRLQRGGCCSKQRLRPMNLSKHHGGITGVVARGGIYLLI